MKLYKCLMALTFIVHVSSVLGVKNVKFKKSIKRSHFFKDGNITRTLPTTNQNLLFRDYTIPVGQKKIDINTPTMIKSEYPSLIKNSVNAKQEKFRHLKNRLLTGKRGTGYYASRSYITASQEKIEKRIQQDQEENYEKTIRIALDKTSNSLKDLRKKLKSLAEPQEKNGIYFYMKLFDHHTFSSGLHEYKKGKADPEKKKICILAARLYLLEQQLQQGISTIDLSAIEHNPFYQYAKNIFFKKTPKENFSRDLESLNTPLVTDDFIAVIHNMRWSAKDEAYTIPGKNNLAQDLYANTLLKYLLFEPKCTTQQFVQFYAFLEKMKKDKEYRSQQLKNLKPISSLGTTEKITRTRKNDAPSQRGGFWSDLISWWRKIFQTASDATE